MLSNLTPALQLDVAILFTALAWSLGFFLADRRFYLFSSLAIGCFVCLVGYTVASAGAPPWLIVGVDVPLDLFLLWYVLRTFRKMAIAYPVIWAIYIVFHVVLSKFVRYDSLIPGWKLHA